MPSALTILFFLATWNQYLLCAGSLLIIAPSLGYQAVAAGADVVPDGAAVPGAVPEHDPPAGPRS
jgi:hypothetical protein